MKTIRKVCIKVLGIRCYLSFISSIYVALTKKGYLSAKYPELFFLEKIIKKGDYCIDIGANLGYYSVKMSALCGQQGKVFAVEPVPMFYTIWKKNVKQSGLQNLELFPYALGSSEGVIQMGMPEKDGLAHHGMTKVASTSNETFVKFFEVNMKVPDQLFKDISRLDFVKCDIEGYEYIAFSNMTQTIKTYKPIIQSELSGAENRANVISLFESMGYTTYFLKQGFLTKATVTDKDAYAGDFYFLQENHSWLLK